MAVRVGIIGMGFMGRMHLSAYLKLPNAKVVAFADIDKAKREGKGPDAGNLGDTGFQFDAAAFEKVYDCGLKLIDDPGVDLVDICVPTCDHKDLFVAAVKAGKSVLCEKPMAVRSADVKAMVAAGKRARRPVMIAQCIRFWPQYETIKRCIDGGRIGAVRFMSLRRLGCPPTYSAGHWLLDGAQSGGALLDLHVHDVDFAHYLLGIPESLFARGTRGPSGDFDHVTATWSYPLERYVALEGGWVLAAPWTFDMEIAVHGERGTLGWAMSRGSEVRLRTSGEQIESIPCEGDALGQELDYFVDCVQAGRPVAKCTPFSSRTSVALSWLERRSIEGGCLISVRERLRAAWTQ